MRCVVILCLALTLCGCSKPDPWRHNFEEQDYLKSLSNPTPEQWKRRERLSGSWDLHYEAYKKWKANPIGDEPKWERLKP